ncbi:MAG TPA: ATP-binding protein, partial [Blastocatellia bacterium]|nr:ATP-binding protein [Blastocatellia bacterium]
NATTVALSFLLVVLAVASAYGLGPGILGSVAGMLCFNFFFLPPFRTFTIHDPQNWVALFAFLITAVMASQLSAKARARARDAEKRREEVWRLYELSRAIIATPDSETAMSSTARQVVEVFGFDYCAVFASDIAGELQRVALASDISFTPDQSELASSYRDGEVRMKDSGEGGVKATYAPLKVGVRSIGVMVLVPSTIDRATVEAVAGLVALAIERARFLKELSYTTALKQSDELKSALLASVSHDLRTPLTSIRAAVDSLLQEEIEWDKSALREFHIIISEEVERLARLVQNLLEMARIEAGELNPFTEWGSVSEIFSSVLELAAPAIRNHDIKVDLDEDMPLVKLDPRLIAEALTNLVENAAKYSPPNTAILMKGRVNKNKLIISVKDQGEGIAPDEQERIFNKFYRSPRRDRQYKEGTGMGLAIARGIIQAHGGRIWVDSAPGVGTTFSFMIPVELKKDAKSLA